MRHDILKYAYDTTMTCFEFIESVNKGHSNEGESEIEVYEHIKTVEFPLDSKGKIDATIHKCIQDKDYTPLKKGTPIFEKFDGEVVLWNDYYNKE